MFNSINKENNFHTLNQEVSLDPIGHKRTRPDSSIDDFRPRKRQKIESSFQNLPTEILEKIILNCDLSDLKTIASLNSEFFDVIQSPYFEPLNGMKTIKTINEQYEKMVCYAPDSSPVTSVRRSRTIQEALNDCLFIKQTTQEIAQSVRKKDLRISRKYITPLLKPFRKRTENQIEMLVNTQLLMGVALTYQGLKYNILFQPKGLNYRIIVSSLDRSLLLQLPLEKIHYFLQNNPVPIKSNHYNTLNTVLRHREGLNIFNFFDHKLLYAASSPQNNTLRLIINNPNYDIFLESVLKLKAYPTETNQDSTKALIHKRGINYTRFFIRTARPLFEHSDYLKRWLSGLQHELEEKQRALLLEKVRTSIRE